MVFIDSTGRSIQIVADYDVEAFHNGKRIGCIEFDCDENNGRAELWGMNVESAYQKAGIGTQMMRVAAELYGKRFGKPSLLVVGGSHSSSNSYYTQEGAALIKRCIREGILEDTEPRDVCNEE